ncbi:MAG: Maf family protein [Clostridiales Family XIII bacterium]|jgi:MAF protein|nr:Maf family protein [Clostridiales Family XIII bacterium]
MDILLASTSPRRYEILRNHGVHPLVCPPRVDEDLPADVESSGPEHIVKYLARKKALDVYVRVGRYRDAFGPHCDSSKRSGLGEYPSSISTQEYLPPILIAADTVVWCDGLIGKPRDEDDAFRMLASYRNRSHEVWSGVTAIDRTTGMEDTFAVCTRVAMGDYTDEEITSYIRRDKPFDKSGSYAIQSDWGKHVTSVDGGIENVMGFPWPDIKEHLIPLVKAAAREILPARTGEWASLMSLKPKEISVGNARKRWGSCKADGGIRYTWRIMLGDDDLVDYLVVHELAHLRHMNHSGKFWSLVESYLPDCKECRKKLRALYTEIENEGWN